MWVIIHKSESKFFYLNSGKDIYIVGRNNGDILLAGDSSISRNHANFILKKSEKNEEISVCDQGSKYGTYINEGLQCKTPILPNVPISIKHNDCIKFGILENIWTIKKLDYITTTSALSAEQRNNVVNIVKSFSGTVESNWNNLCTHLTMETVNLTLKLVQALIAAAPVVTVQFWNDLSSCMKDNKPLPIEKSYIPIKAEPLVNYESSLLNPKSERKTLFSNKTFIFLSSRQHEQFCQIICDAGGKATLLEQSKMTKSDICKSGIIVIQYIRSQYSQLSQTGRITDEIEKYLRRKNCRLIPESEIGLSILYCNTEKYCNPSYDFKVNLLRPPTPAAGVNEILAQETEQLILSQRENISEKQSENGTNVNVSSSNLYSPTIENMQFIDKEETITECKAKKPFESILSTNKTQKRKINVIHDPMPGESCTKVSRISTSKKSQKSSDESELFCFETAMVSYDKTSKNDNCLEMPKNTGQMSPLKMNSSFSSALTTKGCEMNKSLLKDITTDSEGDIYKNDTKLLSSNGLSQKTKKLHSSVSSMKHDDFYVGQRFQNRAIDKSISRENWVSCNESTIRLYTTENRIKLDDTVISAEYNEWISNICKGINIKKKQLAKVHMKPSQDFANRLINFKKFKKARLLISM